MITRAGFPPIHLAEINFEVFYQQRLAAIAQQQAAEAGATAVEGSATVQ
jgi:preprotein translocase subunit SecB